MDCAHERFRGELLGENLEVLEGRRGDKGRSLLNDRATGGEKGNSPYSTFDDRGL